VRTADGYIINKCLNGDSAAFGLLVDKYKESVYALAYSKLRNFHDAEDVAQEVFIRAYTKLRTLRQYDSFHAWLYATTTNLCKDWIRARSRRPDGEFVQDKDPEMMGVLSMDAHQEGEVQASLHESVHEALDSLPEKHRQVLTLHYLGGMSGREIAVFLGIAPMTVWQRLSRARSELKEEMLAMTSKTFEEQRLHGGFTLHVVEAVKRIKIQPMPRTNGLPWGLSLAAGIIITVLSLSPHLNILNPVAIPAGSLLPVDAKVLKFGDIPVDILKVSQISGITGKQDGNDRRPELHTLPNLAPMVAHGEADTWMAKADMSTPRMGFGTSLVNGKIYAIGGWTALAGGILKTVEEYDPAMDTWTKKADMPTSRHGLSTSVVDGKIYALGGWGGDGLGPCSVVEEYDPAADVWTKKANMPGPRCYFGLSVVNGKTYIIGGMGPHTPALGKVEEYDPATDTWTAKADMPTPRVFLSTSAVDDKIYAFGGEVVIQGGPVLAAVEEYDVTMDSWTKKKDMPTAKSHLSTSVVNGKIYVIGGVEAWDGLATSTVREYDPATDTWADKTDIPTARSYFSTNVVDGNIYAIGGGWPGTGLSAVEVYDTGLVPGVGVSNLKAKGKLVVPWGEIKFH